VLALDSAAALESLGLRVEPSEGVVDTEGLGDTELELVDLEGGGSLGGRGRGESGSRGDEGSEKSELHIYILRYNSRQGRKSERD
jgi:hypothetical protein